MVALPTPALAATASMEMAATLCPVLSISSTASRMASSACALRGRPGALRSWPVPMTAPAPATAPVSLTAVFMVFIVTDALRLDQFHALLLGQTFGGRGSGSGRGALSGEPQHGDHRTEQGEDDAA